MLESRRRGMEGESLGAEKKVEGRKSTKWGPRAKSRGKTGQQREIDRRRWTDRMKDERENREDEAKKAVLFQ